MYERPTAEMVVFDLEEVYMLQVESKNDGEDLPFPMDETQDWEV